MWKLTKNSKKIISKIFNKETMTYVLWGLTTTLINVFLYTMFCDIMDYKIANLIAIVIAKVYAYFVNKFLVFHHKCSDWKELFREICTFVITRGFSGIVDYFGVLVMVELFNINKNFSKYSVAFFVIVLNYVFGKLVVFKKKKKEIPQ